MRREKVLTRLEQALQAQGGDERFEELLFRAEIAFASGNYTRCAMILTNIGF